MAIHCVAALCGWQACLLGGLAAAQRDVCCCTSEAGVSPDAVRLKHTCGPLSNVLLYALFFLPTSINTAWLSVATGLGVLIVPVSYGFIENLDIYAVVVAAVITVLGAALRPAPGWGRPRRTMAS